MSRLIQMAIRAPDGRLLAGGAFEPLGDAPASENRREVVYFGRDDQGRTYRLVLPRELANPAGA